MLRPVTHLGNSSKRSLDQTSLIVSDENIDNEVSLAEVTSSRQALISSTEEIEELDGTIDTETAPEISSSYQWKRIFYRGITTASVLLNPLFAVFLYMAISSAMDESRRELNLEDKFWEVFFIILNLSISSMSGLSDVIVVNPIEETEDLLKSLGDNHLSERLNNLPASERRIIKGFNYFNQAIGNSVFFVGSASAALSFTYFSSSAALRWSLGLPVTLLSHVYLNMLSRTKIDEHSYQFIHRILDKNKSIFLNALRSPLKSSEVSIQVLVNALNRGITYGYIMEQILKEFFNEDSSSSPVVPPFIYYAMVSSFYTFLISRTLNVHKQFFNPKFSELSAELLKNTKVSYLGMSVDGIMTLLRAGAASTLLFRHGPTNLPLNIIMTASLGLGLTSHGLYVRYKNRLYQTALDAQLKRLASELRVNNQTLEGELTSEQIFDFIKEKFKVSTGIKISATIINGGSRLADWFSFLGFLMTINKLIESNSTLVLDFYDLLCIQQLLCNPALENALSFFQDGIIDVLAYYRTKIHLEWNDKHFGWKSAWKAKSDYPKDYLANFLRHHSTAIALEEGLSNRDLPRPLPHHSVEEIELVEMNTVYEDREQQSPPSNNGSTRTLTTLFDYQKLKVKENKSSTKVDNNKRNNGVNSYLKQCFS